MKQITIVGAGLVGSLLAIILGKKRHKVTIYEARSDMRKGKAEAGRSINLALSERGLRTLRHADLEEEVKKIAIPMYGRAIHNKKGEVTHQPYGINNQHINSVSRSALNALLMTEAEKHGAEILFNQRCSDIDVEKGVIHFNEKDVKSDLIFGADGAFSAVRTSMMKRDRFTYSQSYLDHGYKELSIPAGENGKWLLEKNALHIWPRKSFMLIALPNIDGSFTCTLFLAFEGEVSFEQLKTEEDINQFFKEQFSDAFELMPTLIEDFTRNPTSSLVNIRCFPWTYKNKVALIGDAAHAIVPFYGQGMNAGFEDCYILDKIIEEHGEDWEKIFKEYEISRKPNADAIGQLAIQNFFEMRDKVGDPHFLRRKGLERKIQKRFPDDYTPQYAMVSFNHTPYKDALQKGKQQENILEELLKIENIEERLDSDEAQKLLTRLFSIG